MPTVSSDEGEREGHQTCKRGKRHGELVHDDSRLGNFIALRITTAWKGLSLQRVASDTPAKTASETLRKRRTLEL